jgi:O-antigen/teichoic acid export membrane protein
MVNRRSLKFNAAMNMVRTAAGMLFPLITFPYMSRVLGPEGVGKINFSVSLVSYFTLLASVGIPLYGIREVAKVRDDKPALSALIQELLVIHGVTSFISLLAFMVLIFVDPKIHQEVFLFFIVSFSVPLSMLTMEWLYQGLEEYAYITIRSVSFSALSVIALFIFVHREQDYVISALITIVASLGSSILNFWNARKRIFAPRNHPWAFRKHVKPLGTVYAMNFIISIYINLDTVMLGFLSTARSVGYYSSAMKLTKILLAMVSSFSAVLLPRLSYYLSNNMQFEFDQMLKKSLGVILLLCLPVTTALMFMSREVILILAGAQYLPAVSCVMITAPVILVIGLNNLFGFQILYAMGKEKAFILSVSAGAIVNVVLNFSLIPSMAHLGAAWGAVIAETVILVVEIIFVRQFYNVYWPWKNVGKYTLATLTMMFVLLFVQWNVSEDHLIMRLVIEVLAGGGVYSLILLLLHEELVGEMFAKVKEKIAHV